MIVHRARIRAQPFRAARAAVGRPEGMRCERPLEYAAGSVQQCTASFGPSFALSRRRGGVLHRRRLGGQAARRSRTRRQRPSRARRTLIDGTGGAPRRNVDIVVQDDASWPSVPRRRCRTAPGRSTAAAPGWCRTRRTSTCTSTRRWCLQIATRSGRASSPTRPRHSCTRVRTTSSTCRRRPSGSRPCARSSAKGACWRRASSPTGRSITPDGDGAAGTAAR